MQQPYPVHPRALAGHAAYAALGRPRPARALVSGTHLAVTQFPRVSCIDDSRDSVIARQASTTTVRSARRSHARRLYAARVVFMSLFVANAMLLGAILGLLVAK